jgi:F-type H+-transporting ATPase subunit b
MAGEIVTTKIIVVAQAQPADALQQGTVVEQQHGGTAAPADAAHAPAGETHASTEVAGGDHGTGIFPPFDPSTFPSQLLWLAITFAALYFLMSRVAIPRIGGILESRRARIEGDLKEADRLRIESERAAAAYEAALAEARKNAHVIAEETRQGIRTDIEGKRAKVEADLSAKVATAEAGIAQSKAAALTNVDQIAADTAATLVGQLAGKVSEAEARDAVAAVAKG